MPTDSATADSLLAAFVSRAGRDDPYPVYRELLTLPGLPRLGDGSLMITRFADCSALLRSPDVGHSDDVGGSRVPGWRDHPSLRLFGTGLLGLDPPAHTRLRRVVSGAFTPRRVAGLRPAVTRIVDELLESLFDDPAAPVDFISAFAFPMPIAVIGELLGVPRADQPPFKKLARDWTHVLDVTTPRVLARADAAATEMRSYLGDLADERRSRPRDDLLSALVAADGLSRDEIITMAALLFAAGFETTTHLLGNGLVALLNHPDQARLLGGDPAVAEPVAEAAVDELLRFDAPVQIARRRALEPLMIGDTAVSPGEKLTVCLGAAGRDPARFTDPDRLDLTRDEGASLAFGAGVHYCLGGPLARLEGQLAFPALLRRYPRIALAGSGMRRVSLTLRGYQRLPVTTG